MLVMTVIIIWYARINSDRAEKWIISKVAEAEVTKRIRKEEWKLNKLLFWLEWKIMIKETEVSNVC